MAVNQIPEKFVSTIWNEIGNIESKAKAEALAEEFMNKQKHLAEYILALTEDLGDNANELGFYLGLIVWMCFEKYYVGNLEQAQPEFIKSTHDDIENEMPEFEEIDKSFVEKKVLNASEFSQKAVLKYISEALFDFVEEDEDDEISSDEMGILFMILTVHTQCLSASVIEK